MRHWLIMTLLMLLSVQSMAASLDLHLLHAASGQHAVHHDGQSPLARAADADPHETGNAPDCQHCCHSHGTFVAQLPVTLCQAPSLLNRQQASTSLSHIPQQQHNPLYRPPII